MTAKEIVLQYVDDILHGNIPSGRYIRLACEKFKEDAGEFGDYYVDWKEVENIYMLGKCLKHYSGACAGKPFLLSPWQLWCASNIFGVKRKDDQTNKYSSIFIKISRKNGKTMMSSLFMLYAAIKSDESPQCFLAANSRSQAHLAFDMIAQLVKQLDPKHKDFKVLRNEIRIKHNNGYIKVISSDASKQDGLSASAFIVDEYEEAPNNLLYENLASSQGARRNPFGMVIGSAGFDLLSADYEMLTRCKKILDGEIEDDTQFSAIYQMDDDDEPYDERNWIKCNPCLGEAVSLDFIRKRVKTAQTSPSQEVPILTKQLNIYCQNSSVWIPDMVLKEQQFNFDWEDFKKNRKDYIVFAGADMAAVSDFTALSFLFYKQSNGKFYFYTKYYLPSVCLQESPNKDLYREWQRRGYLTVTEGNVTDYDYVLNDAVKAYKDFQFIWLGYDKYNATQWVISCTEAGLPMEEFAQNMLNFNQPTRTLERLVRSGEAFIDFNPITYFCFANVELKYDWSDNCLSLDTVVPTPNGNTTIGELHVGDYVFGSDGCPTKVTNVTDIHYDRDCYKIKFHNGSEVVADKMHNWYIETPTCKTINGKKTKTNHYTYRNTEWLYKHSSKTRHTIYNQAVQYSEKTYTIDPYTLGQWLGDGNSSGSVFTCSGEDLHMYDYLKDKYELRITKDKRTRCPNTYEIYVSGGLRTELKKEGLLNNKHIPEKYFYGSANQRMALVQGLMDTDGTCNKINGQCYFLQKRENIAFGLHRLLNSLGIRNSIKLNKKGYYGVSFYTNERVFRLEREYKNQSKYTFPNNKNNYIVSIEKVDSVPTKCITVENDNHLFLITDDYLVTSNCKPVKRASDKTYKIDGCIAMLEALGEYLKYYSW